MKDHPLEKFETSKGNLAFYDVGEGMPVVLLHGFPDSPTTFTNLVGALNHAGYRCIVPYMPGYGDSSLPFKSSGWLHGPEASMLAIGEMLDEFISQYLARETLQIIGHDWGSLVAQMLVALNEENALRDYHIQSAVFYAVPPLGSFVKNINFKQIFRSRYMYYFQGYGVAKTIRNAQFAYIRELWQRWSPWQNAQLNQQTQLEMTIETLKNGHCLENAMTYYRSLLNPYYLLRGSSVIKQMRLLFNKRASPCLMLVGEKDECIGAEMYQGSEACYPHALTRLQVLENVGHFAHLEQPDTVTKVILDFLQIDKTCNHTNTLSA